MSILNLEQWVHMQPILGLRFVILFFTQIIMLCSFPLFPIGLNYFLLLHFVQLMTMQKDWQNQMSNTVTFAVAREGRRQEVALPYDFEKIVKANSDALWARFQEESAKNEKLARGRSQQLTSLISNLINKELAAVLEKVVKKELTACLPAAVRSVTPNIEKAAYSAVVESFQVRIFITRNFFKKDIVSSGADWCPMLQRCVSDKAVNQLEKSLNSRLEATVGRQIQVQFQASGKQALQVF